MILTVYIPVPTAGLAYHRIDYGSGIVGSPAASIEHPDRIRLDYEGNRYGAVNLKTYFERVLHAAGRHVAMYPTVARCWAEPDDVIAVGCYDTESHVLAIKPDAEPLVASWLGLKELPRSELSSQPLFERARQI